MKLSTSIAVLFLLAPGSALANDPMAGWLHQQQMAYQRNRTVKGGIPRATGNLLSPKKAVSKQPTKATSQKPPVKDEGTPIEAATVETQAPANEVAANAEKGSTRPSAAYALGRMVRRLVQAFEGGKVKKAKAEAAPEKTATATTPVETKADPVSEEPRRFEPKARFAQKSASPSSLYLLRRARLISVADYQAGLLQFLGAR